MVAPISNGESGLSVRTKLNELIALDAAKLPLAGGALTGPVTLTHVSTGFTITAPSALIAQRDGGGAVSITFRGYDNSATAGALVAYQAARGSAAVPADVQAGDRLGIFVFGGYAGGGMRNTSGVQASVGTGTISATSLPSYISFLTTPDGSIARAERLRITQDGDIQISVTNVIDRNRLVYKRPYPVAGLPAPVAGLTGAEAYCSNESGGAVPVFCDGTNWRRVTDRAIVS